MRMTQELRKRYVKDYKVPINIFSDPYFLDRIDLFDPYYHTKSSYSQFVNDLKDFENEQDYFEMYNKIKDQAINDIKSSESYQYFNNEDMNRYAVDVHMTSKDVFKESNIGKRFLSIDMIKANFSALYLYNPEMFLYCNTWEEYISHYTSLRHIIDSKYVRQVILGNCNPKRQVTYEKYLMKQIFDIATRILSSKCVCVSFSNDEIVFDVTNDPDIIHEVEHLGMVCKREHPIAVRIEVFQLFQIENTGTYIEKFIDGTIKFKCISPDLLPIIIRKYENKLARDSDLVINHNGLLAKLCEVPQIKINMG